MKYTLFLLLCILSIQVFSEKVSKVKAKKIAENWAVMKMNRSKGEIEKKLHFINNKDTFLYVFNFKNEGFVIVPADDHSCPILAYPMNSQIDMITKEFYSDN